MSRDYIPALGYRWLTPAYDAAVALTTRERTFKRALIEQAKLQAQERVLDLACGTATLTIMAKRDEPTAELTGIDGDPQMLKRACRKADQAGLRIRFDRGMSDQLPYADGAFDKVISSLFFHHLQRDGKLATLTEVRRVLKERGTLHVADWGKAANPLMRAAFLGIQLLDGFPNTSDNVAGRLPDFMREAGFSRVEETRRFSTVFGTLSLYRAA
ncbi:MAG TPA: class I SAM-dependent methyltransferase [Nevskiaceae bacterium]|nr:class I SAM-dependent methyltransferase [Nevskiaceae bacterium]